jgi:hypothetical protein
MAGAVMRLAISRKIRVHARSVDEEARGRLSFRGGLDILLKLTDSQFENAKIKVKNAKLWNPDSVGMTILITVLCFITVYDTTVHVSSWE